MKIKYNKEADAIYIELKSGRFDHNLKVDSNTIIDCDKDNNILGIELLFIKERNPLLLEELKENIISI